MSDLETYLFGICGGKSHSTWFQATNPAAGEWEQHVAIGATQKLVILNMLFRFINVTGGVGPNLPAVSACLSIGTDDTAVGADSNKIHFIERMQATQTEYPTFLNFEGCPIIGSAGQHLHFKGFTITDDEKPTVITQYMIIP